jgi:hypothetical protein
MFSGLIHHRPITPIRSEDIMFSACALPPYGYRRSSTMPESLAAWIDATPTTPSGRVLTQTQIDSWRNRGYAFVSGVFEDTLVAELRADATRAFPPPDSPESAELTDFGSAGRFNFPGKSAAFNAVSLHPRLLAAIAELLDVPTTQLRLTQSDLWLKYGQIRPPGTFDNDDQRIHVDYPNHTLVHPSPWSRPEAVELILYLDDVADCAGATALVPRNGPNDPAYRWPIVDTPGVADLDYINDRSHAEAYFATQRPDLAAWRASLYAREQRVRFKPGNVLFYRHDLWHRGTPLAPGRMRLAHNITYRNAHAEWISALHVGWAWSAYQKSKLFERLIANASLEQRAVLGFPQPGSSYWCSETIAAVEARYGVFGIDMSPYRNATAGAT